MIIKGGARGAAGNLAAHLERKDTNERVSVIGIEGLSATTIKEALHEIDALSCGTQCSRSMYHASISPQPGEAVMTPEQLTRAAEVLAAELGLTGQPHIIVEHTKTGESGINRTHQHVIWSRVDENGKTLSDWNNYPAHERASRRIELELGHQVTQGVFGRAEGGARPERTPSAVEWQQADRSQINPKQAKELLTGLWQQSDGGAAFIAAAADQGFTICRGDKRGFVVLDPAGEIVTLSRRLPDTAAAIAERMPDRETLPTVDEARAVREAGRSVAEEASQIAVETAEAIGGMEVAAEAEAPSPALPSEPHGPIQQLDAGDVQPGPAAGDELASKAAHEPDTPEHATPDTPESVALQQDATPVQSTGDDRFRDESPALAGPAAEPPGMSKGADIATKFMGRAVGKAVEIAADLFEGLLGLFVGAGEPKQSKKTPQVQQAQPQGIQQVATPSPPPPKQRPEPVAAPQVRPSHSFVEAMTQRLSADELARIEADAAQRAELRTMPRDRSRDRDFSR